MSDTVFIATDANGFKFVVRISDKLLPTNLPEFQAQALAIVSNVIGSTPIYLEKAARFFDVDLININFKSGEVTYDKSTSDPIGLPLSKVLGYH